MAIADRSRCWASSRRRACLFRIVDPPAPAGGVLALSLREGAWLALVGSVAIVAGALWPERSRRTLRSDAKLERVWSELSGWTPEG